MTEISNNNWRGYSDDALLDHIGGFIKHNRLQRNLSQAELAYKAGISRSTLSFLESGKTVTLGTLIRVLRVLDRLNIMEVFNVENVISPLLLAKLEQKKSGRAGRKKVQKKKTDW